MANTGGAVAAIQALFPDFSYLRTFDSLHFNRCGNCSTGDIFCSTLNLPQIPPKWIYFEKKKKKEKRKQWQKVTFSCSAGKLLSSGFWKARAHVSPH